MSPSTFVSCSTDKRSWLLPRRCPAPLTPPEAAAGPGTSCCSSLKSRRRPAGHLAPGRPIPRCRALTARRAPADLPQCHRRLEPLVGPLAPADSQQTRRLAPSGPKSREDALRSRCD